MAEEIVLITGISGFIGYATLVSALESGYRVRGVVRKPAQGDTIKSVLPAQFQSQLELITIPDLTAKGAFDDAFKGVAYVIHVASPLSGPSTNYKDDYFKPAINMTTNVLSSAAKFPDIRRLVITSSLSPYIQVAEFATGKLSKEFYRSDDETFHYDMDMPFAHQLFAYAASKSMALDAAENYIKTQSPGYDVVFLMPSFVFGPSKIAQDPEEFNKGSNAILVNHLLGKSSEPLLTVSVHIDDVAKIHVESLKPSVPAGRYLLDRSGTDWSVALPVVKKNFPETIGKVFPEEVAVQTIPIKLDSTKAEKAFGIEFKSFEEQVKDTAAYYTSILPK
ncbi:putative nad dependent epimerase dehydratase protein [Eutypa lata UCREL1]|uniref:Putative nad dependent epimerase dehydratase protein n=1 Tax=Eutypa lata (strain UCR-EL1) TaxID=1287681 RepID=M7SN67_EUTLA|nr:putative nad dependent epimerase dehydratase protein [Eutypa lata UCREL1]